MAKGWRFAYTFLAYCYWPLVYFGIYLPFVAPNLGHWKRIPVWIPIIIGIGFAFILVCMGIRNSQKTNFFHAIGIQISLLLFSLLMAQRVMPGFKKSELGLNPLAAKAWRFSDLIILVAPVIMMVALAEGGRVLLRKKAR